MSAGPAQSTWARRLLAAGALWAVLSLYKTAQHLTFNTGAFDLGFRASILYNMAFHGKAWNSLAAGHAFAGHFHPVSLALAPLYRIFPSPLLLSLLSAASVASAFFLVLELSSRRGLDRRATAALTAMFLANPFLHQVLANDFHPEIFAIPLVLLFFLLFDAGRTALAVLAALCLLSLKEDMGLLVMSLGIYALVRRRRSAGAVLGITGAAWLPLVLLAVLPRFHAAGSSELVSLHYSTLGSSAREIFMTSAAKPWLVLTQVFGRPRTLLTMALLAFSIGPAVLRPEALLALPLLVAHLAADYAHQLDLTWQYSAGILPLLMYAAVRGASRLSKRTLLLLSLLAVPAIVARFPNPFPEGVDLPKAAALRRLIASVPAGESLSVSNNLAPHVVNRPNVLLYPRIGGARYVLVDLGGNIYPARWEGRRQDFDDSTAAYGLVDREGDAFLMRRR